MVDTMRTRAGRARRHYARERRLQNGLDDGRLFGEYAYQFPTGSIPGFSLDERRSEVTVSCDVLVTAGAAQGVLWELGGLNVGIGVAIGIIRGQQRLVCGAGERLAVLTSGEQTWTNADSGLSMPQRDYPYHIVFAARPGVGKMRMWVDGVQVVGSQASKTNFGTDSRWSNGAIGSYFSAYTNLARAVGVLESGAPPVGCQAVSPLRVYTNQRPRDFGFNRLDRPIGGPGFP